MAAGQGKEVRGSPGLCSPLLSLLSVTRSQEARRGLCSDTNTPSRHNTKIQPWDPQPCLPQTPCRSTSPVGRDLQTRVKSHTPAQNPRVRRGHRGDCRKRWPPPRLPGTTSLRHEQGLRCWPASRQPGPQKMELQAGATRAKDSPERPPAPAPHPSWPSPSPPPSSASSRSSPEKLQEGRGRWRKP